MATAVILLLFVLIAIGMPLAFALGVVGAVGVWLFAGFEPMLSFLAATPFSNASNYELMTVPMFILMAEFVIVSGVAEELFLAITTSVRCAVMSERSSASSNGPRPVT